MALRDELINLQFKPATPNTVLYFGENGLPTYRGAFQGATIDNPGSAGLVPTPLAGQHQLFLRADGVWAAAGGGGGGSGNVNGNGVANRLSFWIDPSNISSNGSLTFDVDNSILKASTINLSRNSLPGAGITNGDFLYDTSEFDFRARINGAWANITRMNEFIEPGVNFTPNETHRNSIVRFTSNSNITVNLTQVSNKYSITLVKAGNGNITVTTGATNTYTGASNTISVSGGSAHFYHLSNNQWRGYGGLGATGTGTVRSVKLAGISGIIGVALPDTITSEGTLQLTLNLQTPGTFFRGPLLGAAPGVPTFGLITTADIPKIQFDSQSAAVYTLRIDEDYGRVVDVTGAGAHEIHIPAVLPEGWFCSIYRGPNTGAITFISDSNTLEAEAGTLATPKTMASIIVFPGTPNRRHIVVGKLT